MATSPIRCQTKATNVTNEQTCLATKLLSFMQLSELELGCLAALQTNFVSVQSGAEISYEGQTNHLAYIVQSGWGCSFKMLPDGDRQIITFPVPGDCVGLRSILLRASDHSFSALTDLTLSAIEAPRMMSTLAEFPRLGSAILWAVSRDEAMIVEHLVSIGRRSAIERTAHFFLELYERLLLVGLARNDTFDCPLTQYVLADALGLSAIHVNRTLRQLRELELMTVKDKHVVIHNVDGLKELAGYGHA
ncbi:MAG: Crp/Fnr family transcriptional regulator [Hyphomicrobiaceae bacterium]